MPEEMLPSTAIVQSGANASNYTNVKFPAEMANLALADAVALARTVNTQAAQIAGEQGANLVRTGRAMEALTGTMADKILNSQPSELAGEGKILYGSVPTGFTGVGHYPAEPATGS